MNPTDQVVLVVEGGPNDEEEIPLTGPVTSLGRQSSNDVVVAETGVSRQHAEILRVESGYNLRDLSSTNGTFVNSKKIEQGDYLLQDGDTIRLGASKVSYIFRSPMAGTMAITIEQSLVDEPFDTEGAGSPQTMVTELVGAKGSTEEEELYEGTVRLLVKSEGTMGLIVNFVQQLRERQEFRLLRMENSRDGSTNIWLALREPVLLRDMLFEIDGVADISLTEGSGQPGSDDAPLVLLLKEG